MSLGPSITDRIAFAIKVSVFAICLYIIFGGQHPPAIAQKNEYPVVPVLTVEDAVQDHDIADLNKHLEATDTRLAKQWDAVAKNTGDLAGMQGEERIIGGILGGLISVSITLQLRRKTV